MQKSIGDLPKSVGSNQQPKKIAFTFTEARKRGFESLNLTSAVETDRVQPLQHPTPNSLLLINQTPFAQWLQIRQLQTTVHLSHSSSST